MSCTVRHPLFVWIAGVLGIVVIGWVDYLTGAEVRVFPLYYGPITFVAWYRGRSGALILAALCAIAWLSSNRLAGLSFSHAGIWVTNTLVQGASFAIVGLLIAALRATVIRERGLSRTDPLTSLLNTRAFYEEADRILALCRRKGRPVTVAYIDLRYLKTWKAWFSKPTPVCMRQRRRGRIGFTSRSLDTSARVRMSTLPGEPLCTSLKRSSR